MTAPPTDEQVADMIQYAKLTANPYLWPVADLAAEVQEYRALRPDCPTCGGSGRGEIVYGGQYGVGSFDSPVCADCADGKMPLDKWVALLVETLRSLRTDFAADGYPTVAYVPTIDAVLKMVPKVAERRSEVTAEQVAP